MSRPPKKKESCRVGVILTGKALELVMSEKEKYDSLKIMCGKAEIIVRLLEGRDDKRLHSLK